MEIWNFSKKIMCHCFLWLADKNNNLIMLQPSLSMNKFGWLLQVFMFCFVKMTTFTNVDEKPLQLI